ncbi:MAG: hypothetical protein PVJ45_04540 [Desulfobacterales bacterium]|jgi:hypothetical protein
MTYNFKTQYTKQLYNHVSNIVPIILINDDGITERVRMQFDDSSQNVEIRYKSTADEIVDIAHELLHVRMQFHDRFPLLSWPANHPNLSPGIEDLVKQIGNIVNNTYILHHLFIDTEMLPISNVFYDEIRRDIKRGTIYIVQSLPPESRPLASAWRLRLADLSCSQFREKLSHDQNRLSTYFISHFQSKDPVVQDLFIYLRQNVVGSRLSNEHELGDALMRLCDKLGLPSWLHLASRQKINNKWVLTR